MGTLAIIFVILCFVAGVVSRTKKTVNSNYKIKDEVYKSHSEKSYTAKSEYFIRANDEYDLSGYSNRGINPKRPILMSSTISMLEYLDNLKAIKLGLNYSINNNNSELKENLNEIEFTYEGKFIFFIYIYSKSDTNLRTLPWYFENIDTFIK